MHWAHKPMYYCLSSSGQIDNRSICIQGETLNSLFGIFIMYLCPSILSWSCTLASSKPNTIVPLSSMQFLASVTDRVISRCSLFLMRKLIAWITSRQTTGAKKNVWDHLLGIQKGQKMQNSEKNWKNFPITRWETSWLTLMQVDITIIASILLNLKWETRRGQCIRVHSDAANYSSKYQAGEMCLK